MKKKIEEILNENSGQKLIDQLFYLLESELKGQREEIIEEVEKVFDNYRSSNQKVKGKRRFGVPDFVISVRLLHYDILRKLKE